MYQYQKAKQTLTECICSLWRTMQKSLGRLLRGLTLMSLVLHQSRKMFVRGGRQLMLCRWARSPPNKEAHRLTIWFRFVTNDQWSKVLLPKQTQEWHWRTHRSLLSLCYGCQLREAEKRHEVVGSVGTWGDSGKAQVRAATTQNGGGW